MAEEQKENQTTNNQTEETEKTEEKEEVKVPEKFADLVKKIEEMSALDLAELVKILEKKFGVTASAPVAVAQVPAGGQAGQEGGGAPAEEKTSFNVVLTSVGDKKIEVIKVVRDVTQKGLKEAKDLVDAAGSAPQIIKEGVKKEEAEEIKKKFEQAGAKIELK